MQADPGRLAESSLQGRPGLVSRNESTHQGDPVGERDCLRSLQQQAGQRCRCPCCAPCPTRTSSSLNVVRYHHHAWDTHMG